MIWNVVVLIFSLLVVVRSADWFLGAAERIGVTLRLPPFILGVVLVGFGTSLPELATSITAVTENVDNVAIANIVGSNITNVLVIIGISTIALGTIKFEKNLIDLDIPLLIAVTALFTVLIVDGSLSHSDGWVLLVGFLGYMAYSLGYKEDKEHHKGLISLITSLTKGSRKHVERSHNLATPLTVFTLFASIVLLAGFSKLAVDNLLEIVQQTSFSVDVLSFFALAIGTSLPELVVSIKALRKGEGDIVVGGIIGSSMFNILLIGGIASTINTQFIDGKIVGWAIAGLAVSTLLLMTGSISKRIHIWEGMMYMLIYAAIAGKIIQS